MYCPSCGSNNAAGTKFCTRCGTNLTAVTDALTGRVTEGVRFDERSALIREYSLGRRNAIFGGTLFGGGLLMMTMLTLAGVSPIGAFFIVCVLYVLGTIFGAKGLSAWFGASTEMKAKGYVLPGTANKLLPPGTGQKPGIQIDSQNSHPAPPPLFGIGSVTEDTTRTLRKTPPVPPSEEKKE
jgi:hypothetical protein